MKSGNKLDFLKSAEWKAWKACRDEDGKPIKGPLAKMQCSVGKVIVHSARILSGVPGADETVRLKLLEDHARRIVSTVDARQSTYMPPMEAFSPVLEFTRSVILKHVEDLTRQSAQS